MTGATRGAETAYRSGTPEFTPIFTCISGFRVVHFVKLHAFAFFDSGVVLYVPIPA